jgi:microcystin-dependent protein
MIDHVPPWGIECDGAVVSRATYNRLFARLGTLYGIGDGSTTFGLPDLRGMFLRGFDNGRGLDPDAGIRTALGSGSGGNSIATSQPAATNLLGHAHVNTVMVFTGGGVDHVAGGSNQQDVPGSTGGPNVSGNETRPVNTYTMYVMRY